MCRAPTAFTTASSPRTASDRLCAVSTETVATVLTAIGILSFAISGALLAVRRDMDVVGMLVLATATALGGGLLRDVLIGDVPPEGLRTTWWLAIVLVATVATFFFHGVITRLWRGVQVFDAVGLGVFCATSAAKALAFGLGPVQAVLVGTIGGVAGGAIRDMLAREVPSVLRRDTKLYAVPAVLGSALVVVAIEAGLSEILALVVAGVTITVTRILALWRNWRAPAPRRA